jgi:hypothetical protein
MGDNTCFLCGFIGKQAGTGTIKLGQSLVLPDFSRISFDIFSYFPFHICPLYFRIYVMAH